MCNSTQHGEFRGLVQPKSLAHPREEMGQTKVAPSDALGDTGTSTGKRQGSYAVWAKHDVWVGFTKVDVCLEDIFSFGVIASRYVSIWKDF